MIECRGLALQLGGHWLFQDIDLTLHRGWKIGVSGANGVGKSSLFRLLQGYIEADAGSIFMPSGLRVASMEQDVPALQREAIEYVIDGDSDFRRIESEVVAAERAHLGERLGELHAQMESCGGYAVHARAARLLSGLGFPDQSHRQLVSAFSGGWRVRLSLARTLMSQADLLLLDEPTNHLDLETVVWLEGWLRGFEGTLLLVSHDRELLDNVVDHVLHIEHRKVLVYDGNYHAFERQRAERLAQRSALLAKQQREAQRIRGFVDRFRAKASKARQVQSRIKTLARMESESAAHVDSPFTFEFATPDRQPDPLLTIESSSVEFAGRSIISSVSVSIRPGDRLGLLGRNGSGKTTLLRVLAGELCAHDGTRCEGNGLQIGYFAQHQLEQLDGEASPIQHILRLTPDAGEARARTFLGSFGFSNDRALHIVAPFSGGEKARLALALVVWKQPNLLLLDEPTNHLDLDMRRALTVALQSYGGAMIVVSHDRHLLRATCDEFLLVHEARVSRFPGDLEAYRDLLKEQRREEKLVADSAKPDRREERRMAAQQRQLRDRERRPLERKITKVEGAMDRLRKEQAEIEVKLSDPLLYRTGQETLLRSAVERSGRLGKELEDLEFTWLQLSEELEQL